MAKKEYSKEELYKAITNLYLGTLELEETADVFMKGMERREEEIEGLKIKLAALETGHD